MSSKLLLPIGVALALLVAVWAIFQRGETAGAAKVTQKVEREHAERVVESRGDERTAAATAASIANNTIAAEAKTDALVQATIGDLRNALDQVPPAVPGAALPPAPAVVLAQGVNAVIDRANRAADDAAAAP